MSGELRPIVEEDLRGLWREMLRRCGVHTTASAQVLAHPEAVDLFVEVGMERLAGRGSTR